MVRIEGQRVWRAVDSAGKSRICPDNATLRGERCIDGRWIGSIEFMQLQRAGLGARLVQCLSARYLTGKLGQGSCGI